MDKKQINKIYSKCRERYFNNDKFTRSERCIIYSVIKTVLIEVIISEHIQFDGIEDIEKIFDEHYKDDYSNV